MIFLLDSMITENTEHRSRVSRVVPHMQVSIDYLLSSDFMQLAMQRTGQPDPTFMDMKTAFWLSDDPIGANMICPRDNRQGCAMIDWLPRSERREQNYFLSWTWRYTLSQVRSALLAFQQDIADHSASNRIFLFMCFFVNNQFRIIVEGCTTGSSDLDTVFENNLRRIGRMVAILDTWEQPVYLTRIWTVYEQFVASTLEIEARFMTLSRHLASEVSENND